MADLEGRQRRRFQFSLLTLLLVVTISGLVFALWRWLGSRGILSLTNLCVLIVMVLLVPTAVVMSAVQRRRCGSRLRQSLQVIPPGERHAHHRRAVLAAIFAPVVLSLLFWATHDSSGWVGGARPLGFRLCLGLWQACGPLAFVLVNWGPLDPWAVVVLFCATWIGYLRVVFTTKLQWLHYTDHLVLSWLWCVVGCGPSGLVIT